MCTTVAHYAVHHCMYTTRPLHHSRIASMHSTPHKTKRPSINDQRPFYFL